MIRPPRGKLKRFLRTSLVVTTVGIVCIASTWFFLNRSLDARLQQAMAEADRDDPNWRLADLVAAPSKLAPDANSAELVRKALSKIKNPWPETELLGGLERIPFDQVIDNEIANRISRALDEQTAALEAARSLSEQPDGALVFTADSALNLDFGYLSRDRILARLLMLDVLRQSQEGKIDGALDSLRAEINVARSVGDAPFSIAQLFRIAMVGSALETLERVLAQGKASDASLERIENLLIEEEKAPRLLWGLRGERATVDQNLQEYARGNYTGILPMSRPSGWLSPALEPMWKHNRVLMLGLFNRSIAIARQPAELRPGMFLEFEAANPIPTGLIARSAGAISYLMVPSILSSAQADFRLTAQLRTSIALVACERHRIKHGTWPSSIAEIDAAFFHQSLLDPYTGLPLRLEPRDNGLVVYSVGPDLTDDHGVFDLRKYRDPGHDIGYRLRNPGHRRLSPPLPDLPENVFQSESEVVLPETKP